MFICLQKSCKALKVPECLVTEVRVSTSASKAGRCGWGRAPCAALLLLPLPLFKELEGSHFIQDLLKPLLEGTD